MKRSTPIAGLLAAVLVVILAGCGEDRPDRADTTQGTAVPPQESDQITATLTQQQLELSLLTVEDLPAGWSEETSGALGTETGSDSDVIEPAECAVLFEGIDEASESLAEVEASFVAEFGLFLTHSVATHETAVSDEMGQLSEAFGQCPEFSSTDADGVTSEYTAAPLSFSDLGDQTVALRLQGATEDFELVIDTVFIAVGSNSIVLVAGGLGPMESDELEGIATTAVERLRDAAG